MKRPIIIGHRGYSAVAPENTLAAFQRAVETGVPWIECDVRRTKDNVFTVIHDATLQRTTSGVGYIRNMEWKDVQHFDAGSWFNREFNMERIPLLEQVFESIPDSIALNLELKPARLRKNEYERFVTSLFELLHRHNRIESVLISSFSSPLLRKVREAHSTIRLGVLTHGNVVTKPTIRELHELRATWFIHNIRTLRPSVVSAIQAEGFSVAAFTVNSPKHADHAMNCGVDYIITNEIERIREYCERRFNRQDQA